MPVVKITDHYCFPDIEPEKRVFDPAGISVTEIAPHCTTQEDVIRTCDGADALLVLYAPITRAVLEALPSVKCIVRYGIGYNNFDIQACRDLGVTAANVPDYCIEEVSNHTLAMILALARRIPHDYNHILAGGWDINQFRPIPAFDEMTLGLVSFGKLARCVAKKTAAFGFRVVAFDPLAPDASFADLGVERVNLDTLLATSDVISLHCPLLPETTHLINRDSIARMKHGVVIVNTARGPVINEPDLVEALRSGHVSGAGLDVFEKEPLPEDSAFRGLPNVLLTSHSAWVSEKAMTMLQTKAAEAACEFLQGRRPSSALT